MIILVVLRLQKLLQQKQVVLCSIGRSWFAVCLYFRNLARTLSSATPSHHRLCCCRCWCGAGVVCLWWFRWRCCCCCRDCVRTKLSRTQQARYAVVGVFVIPLGATSTKDVIDQLKKPKSWWGGKGCPAPAPPDAYDSPTSKYNSGREEGDEGGSLLLLSCFRFLHCHNETLSTYLPVGSTSETPPLS